MAEHLSLKEAHAAGSGDGRADAHRTPPRVEVGQVVEATGWKLKVADDLGTTPAPTEEELRILRDLKRASV